VGEHSERATRDLIQSTVGVFEVISNSKFASTIIFALKSVLAAVRAAAAAVLCHWKKVHKINDLDQIKKKLADARSTR